MAVLLKFCGSTAMTRSPISVLYFHHSTRFDRISSYLQFDDSLSLQLSMHRAHAISTACFAQYAAEQALVLGPFKALVPSSAAISNY
jgi:hypothetical protein